MPRRSRKQDVLPLEPQSLAARDGPVKKLKRSRISSDWYSRYNIGTSRNSSVGRAVASVAFVRDIVQPNARRGAVAVGRDPDALSFPVAATVSINNDSELARDSARASICKLFHPIPHPYYDSQFRQLGYDEFANQAARLMSQGRLREAMALVPEEVIDTMTITGSLDECTARIREYEGVADELILARTAQRGEARGMAAYEDLFQLVDRVSR